MKKMFLLTVILFLFTSELLLSQTKIKAGFAQSLTASFDFDTKDIATGQSLFALSGIYTEKGFVSAFTNFSGENLGVFSGYQIKGPFSGYIVANKSWLNRHGYYALGTLYSMSVTKDIGVSFFAEVGSSTQKFGPVVYSGFFLVMTPTIWSSQE
jgi:hypothetical protein